MERARFGFDYTAYPVTRSDRVTDLLPVARGQYIGVTVPRNAWLQVDLDGRWTVAYRLAIQAGRPVVAEVRLFPSEPGSAQSRGEWSGRFNGVNANVPTDGVTASLLRRVTPGKHLSELPRLLRRLTQQPWSTYTEVDGRVMRRAASPERLFAKDGWLGAAGFRAPTRRGLGRQRPRHGDTFYAQVAAAYVEAISLGSASPIRDVAKRLGENDPRVVRNWISRAREKKLLTGCEWGRAGGELTRKGKMLLEL